MRHRKRGRKLGRTSSHRKALMRNMACSLLAYERIVTSSAKAKEVKPFVEKLITAAKKGIAKRDTDRTAYLHAYRRVLSELQDKAVVKKLFGEGDWREDGGIAARYVDRPGGYTRILRLSGSRMGSMVGTTSEARTLEYTMYGIEPKPIERKLKLIGNALGDNSSRVMFELVEAAMEADEDAEDTKPVVKPAADDGDTAEETDEEQAEAEAEEDAKAE